MTLLGWLLGCGGAYDGSWLLALVERGGDGEASGERQDALVSLYTTASGQALVEVEGLVMSGAAAQGALDVSAYTRASLELDDCTVEEESTVALSGEFVGAGELTGTIKVTDATRYDGCGGSDGRTRSTTYDVTGLRLVPGSQARDLDYAWLESYGYYDYGYDYEYDEEFDYD